MQRHLVYSALKHEMFNGESEVNGVGKFIGSCTGETIGFLLGAPRTPHEEFPSWSFLSPFHAVHLTVSARLFCASS